MDVKNCKGCGRLFNYLSGPMLCPACLKALDDKFVSVKEYVYDHPGCGIQEVSDEMDVTIPQIKQWIREERLAFTESSAIGLECEGCGITIKTGRYCKACKDRIAKGFQELYKEEKPEPKLSTNDYENSPRMRFLDGTSRNN